MRDPHVVSLRYELVAGEGVVFDAPAPIEWETEAFRMRLEDGIATFQMIEHHASEDSATKGVLDYLQAWEIDAGLRFGRREMRFVFEKAHIIDRDPQRAGAAAVLRGVATMTAKARILVKRGEYPKPPDGFVASPDVDTMWRRYEGYLADREPLGSMAYVCLTLLEVSAGRKRKDAARKYNINDHVLDMLGKLSTVRGDALTVRKVETGTSFQPFTGAEKKWVEAAVRALIRRAGEYASDPNASWPKITMNDLPRLTTR